MDRTRFGRGKHYCLGAPLAKLEAAITLAELVDRKPNLRLVPQDLEFNPNIAFRGPRELVVHVD